MSDTTKFIKKREDGKYYYDMCLKHNIPVYKFSNLLPTYDIYVDALLGTGFNGILKSEIKEAINYLNNTNKPIIKSSPDETPEPTQVPAVSYATIIPGFLQ